MAVFRDIFPISGLAGLLLGLPCSGEAPIDPTAQTINGTYQGVYSQSYNQDFFLGIPYAQPPLGQLRLAAPQPLKTSWAGIHTATQYSPECIGYGSDQWVLGNKVSEDCLTINIVRPSGVQDGSDLPVAAWIHGGGYYQGGSSDPRYNLSFIVKQSVEMEKPMIGVSFNYRLAEWGFLYSQELVAAGATNLGLRDQRLALHWVQENIAAFGGDPRKVTIWGESAGAGSVGAHLVAYGGRDNGLFRAAIEESGGAQSFTRLGQTATNQQAYNAIVNEAGCNASSDTLACLRMIPTETLNNIFNSSITENATIVPMIDNDFLLSSGTTALRKGQFVKVPLLAGANHDEGTAFGTRDINTTEQFLADIMSAGPDNATALTLAALYPDIPEIEIPSTLQGRPPAANLSLLGYMWKRAAAYGGDLIMHAPRRMSTQMWAKYNQTAYSYHFNAVPNGPGYLIGSTHFQEVAFVFDNTAGDGYNNPVAVDPFENEPATLTQLANIMSRMWVSFITELDPNNNGATTVRWPTYSLDNPENILFDVNITDLARIEPDTYRAEGIQYIADRLDTVYGR